ncbi:BTB/POZ domain-containing protein [Rhizophagus clarus]|uniref:BTB/POZ domain-containing protein n=1 Tax=Rhizophagus clarus TaxID=94130 RepID=A0A8H3L6X2_9GLOM|nr:BTB/POZ domain-containing protein [Rhizophagus clarus]
MTYNLESELSHAFGQLLITEMDYNVIIHVGVKPNFKEFHAHSIILRCRSEYFNKMLTAENIEMKDGKYIIKKPNTSPQAFDIILNYLYTGQVNIANKTGTELLDFMILSNELVLKRLTKLTEEFIMENQQQFLQNDPVGIFKIIYYYEPFTKLQEYYLESICSEPIILFNSDKFTQLSAPLLEMILKRDDLNLNEIEIWESLIKWGLAQDKTLNQDVSKWNKDDINIFKRIVYKFIPLIRFYDISGEDYFNKVKPYEEILSKELRDDILKSYLIPGYEPTYTPRGPKYYAGSIVISREHLTLFSKWIDKKHNKNIPYEFNLLYRASRDGNKAATFHAKCDNKGATIVVVKIKNSEQIVGGYNPLFWDSRNGFKSTGDSFIFSFENKYNHQTAKVVYSSSNKSSIYCHCSCGPVFGCNDLYVNYDNNPDVWYHQCTNCYPKLDLPESMNVVDYEVFQVIKK